jgi:plastocyanin
MMIRRAFLILGASAVFLTNVACHTEDVSITDNAFTPEDISDGLDVLVGWTNNGADTHDVTSSGNGVFFDSPDLAPTATFAHEFPQPGLYKYKCTFHPTEMKGSVGVAVLTSTASTTQGSTVSVTWSFDDEGPGEPPIPDGFNVDVQLDKPGRGGFEDWRINQKGTETSDDFTAKKAGTYRVRARFQKGRGAATSYSPPVEVAVAPA